MKTAPLSGGFMVTSIVGFLASILFVYKISISWGVAFAVFFAIMFIASVVYFTYNPLSDDSFKKKSKNR